MEKILGWIILLFSLGLMGCDVKHPSDNKTEGEIILNQTSKKKPLPSSRDIPAFFNLTPSDFAVNNSNSLKGERLFYNSDSISVVRAEYDINIYVKHPNIRREMKGNKYTAVTDSSLIMTVKYQNILGVLELLDHSCDAKVTFQFIED